MKTKRFYQILLCSLILFFHISCGTTYLGGYEDNHITASIYKGGYWGAWDKQYSSSAIIHYTDERFVLVIHSKDSHPSDFKIKIIGTAFVEEADGWLNYSGDVEVYRGDEILDHLSDAYSSKVDIHNLKENHIAFPCHIKLSKKPKDLLKKHGTVNVFYNGVARAYNF